MSAPGVRGPSLLGAGLARGGEAERPVGVDADLERLLRARLLRESGLALFGHPLLIAIIVALAWSDVPHSLTLGWAVAVVFATVIRAVWLRVVARRALNDRAIRQGVRLTVLLLGLAWGVGAAVVVRMMSIEDVALVLVVLAGIIAGALTTLTADPPSFYALLGSLVLPLLASLATSAHERAFLVSAAVTALFAVAMALVYWKAHVALLEHLAVTSRLAVSDATAKRERAFLDSVFQSVPDAILVVDREGRMRAANPGFTTLFGYTVAEVVGQSIADALVPPAGREAHLDLVRRVNAGETVVAEVERRRKDGEIVTVQLAAAPVMGDLDGARLLLYTDLTTRKRAEEAMRQARDLAERTGRARAAFLANMSHEIRTPMNAVLGFVELILDTELTAEQRRALELVRSSSEALLTILNDILDYSKIEAEHLELESIPFDLPKLVHATSSLLAVRAREKHLELLADVPPDLPRMVRGDPTRLRQVLTNLIGNAIKFTEEGEVVVSVAGSGMEDGRARLRLGVRDTGIGIAAEQLTTIFEEFTQADASMTRRYGGTGLGLAISQKLVRLMGGELAVTSALGQGSDFYFTVALPVETVAAPSGTHPAVVVGRRVLVVDDNHTNRRILRDMLGAEGMAVEEATSAGDGLLTLRRASERRTPFDLAILDVQMPDRDGFELAGDIRAERGIAATRLLMLTSAGQRGDGERCRELGIAAYLSKPISRADLVEALGVVLAGPAAGGGAGLVTRHTLAESRPSLHVLLAEDNPVNQQVAVAMLVKRGHAVDVASNGREALEAVQARAYDVVLMDVQMPEMDGFEATRAIRALPAGKDLPIIALTAHALTGERERCLQNGMTGYLTKPFRGHELFALIEERPGPATGSGPNRPPASPPVPPVPPDSAPPAPVDLETFRAAMRDAGAEEAVDGILDTFVQQAPTRLAGLTAAVSGGAADAVARAAHTLRGAAATIGARELAGLLEEIELAARDGNVAQAREGIAQVGAELGVVLEYLRRSRAGRATSTGPVS